MWSIRSLTRSSTWIQIQKLINAIGLDHDFKSRKKMASTAEPKARADPVFSWAVCRPTPSTTRPRTSQGIPEPQTPGSIAFHLKDIIRAAVRARSAGDAVKEVLVGRQVPIIDPPVPLIKEFLDQLAPRLGAIRTTVMEDRPKRP